MTAAICYICADKFKGALHHLTKLYFQFLSFKFIFPISIVIGYFFFPCIYIWGEMTKITESLVNHSNSIKNFNKHVYHFRLSFGWNYVTSSCVYLFIYLTGRFRNSNQVLERSSVFQLSPSNAKNESSLLKTIKEMNEDMLRALLAANSTLLSAKKKLECSGGKFKNPETLILTPSLPIYPHCLLKQLKRWKHWRRKMKRETLFLSCSCVLGEYLRC